MSMPVFGPSVSGFNLKRFSDSVKALQAAYIGIHGNPNLNDDSVIGQRIGLMATPDSQIWEGLQLAYNAPFASLTDAGSRPNVMASNGL